MDKPRNPLVIYHSNCFDGWCGAWLFKSAFPDADLYYAQYGKEPPNCVGRHVFIVDFSYPLHFMMKIARECASLTVLDHHVTAKEALLGSPLSMGFLEGQFDGELVFDMSKSGGRLAWEFLYRKDWIPQSWLEEHSYTLAQGPWLVDYTEDRDLWKFSMHESKAINAYVRSFPFDLYIWDNLSKIHPGSSEFSEIIGMGKAILRCESQIVADHTRVKNYETIAGHRVPVVNATTLFSEIASVLAKGELFAAAWFRRGDGKVQWSLRSDSNGLNVADIAKQFGGGGHPSAAGFQTDGLLF